MPEPFSAWSPWATTCTGRCGSSPSSPPRGTSSSVAAASAPPWWPWRRRRAGPPCGPPAQYLSYAPTHSLVEWEVTLAVVGGHVTQGRAVGRVGDQEILTVNAALGDDQLRLNGVWVEPPVVPPPEDCPPRFLPEMFRNTIMDKIEVRVAKGLHAREMHGEPGAPTRPCGPACRAISPRRPPRWPSSATTSRVAPRSRWGAAPWAAAWTTPCGWPSSSPPSGCSATSGSTP